MSELSPSAIRSRILAVIDAVEIAFDRADNLREILRDNDSVVYDDILSDSHVGEAREDLRQLAQKMGHALYSYLPEHFERLKHEDQSS